MLTQVISVNNGRTFTVNVQTIFKVCTCQRFRTKERCEPYIVEFYVILFLQQM